MAHESITGGFKKLKEDLGKMTFKEKLNHIWTYYKGGLVVLILLIMAGSLLSSIVINKTTKLLLSGMTINVELSEEGHRYLYEDLFERIKTGKGREKVYLTDSEMEDFSTSTNYNENYYAITGIQSLAANGELDYMILDKVGLSNMIRQEAFMDLRKFFTQEQITGMGMKVIYRQQGEDGEPIPVAVDITDTAFIQDNVKDPKEIYFCLIGATPRLEECKDLWQYIMDWEKNVKDPKEIYFCLIGATPRLEECKDLWQYIMDWEKAE